jgi:hypothetical protein
MMDVLLYIILPSSIFGSGYGIGFLVGKIKYMPRKPTPNYLGGSSK